MTEWVEFECPNCNYQWKVDRRILDKANDVPRSDEPAQNGKARLVRKSVYRSECPNPKCDKSPYVKTAVFDEIE